MLTEKDINWMNFQLICKPEQSGKTFVMIQHIIKDLTNPVQIVNFIFCDNNLLLTKQTSSRVDCDLREYIVEGISYAELSSSVRTDVHTYEKTLHAIVFKKTFNIICCTNGKRMDDIYKIISQLNDTDITKGKYHFNIWLDEADKFVNFIDSTLIPIVETSNNVNVKLITATPGELFKKYKYINVFPIENTTSELYHGWEDNKIRIIDIDTGCVEFADHILSNVANHQINPGTKWFIPGLNVKKSHDAIKNICLEKKMAVLCVNGNGMVLTFPDTLEQITYKKDDVFNNKINEIYIEQRLENYPLVITGNICIGRGITIMSDKFMLDYAILSHCSNKSEASQIAGRIKGNIKGFASYNAENSTVVFTTEYFNATAIEMEKKSRALAKLAYEKDKCGTNLFIDNLEFKTCGKSFKYICHKPLFDSFEKARSFLITKQRDMDCKITTQKKKVIHECDGYYVTSKLLTPGKTVNDLTKYDRITYEKAKNISTSRCISSTDKGSRYLILPVYENEDTPGKNVKYQVRYIKFEKPVHK